MLAVYFALVLVMTYPLALRVGSALPAGSGDVWMNYWNFWWWKQSLLEWRSPFWTSVLYHPFGIDLRCHTHSVFNQILALPVNLVAGEAAALNFSLFFHWMLSAFSAWLLLRDQTGNAAAAFLGGAVFAFFPYAMEQSLEHLNLASTGFLPLTLFFLLRWRRSSRIRDALGFGACFGFNALSSWHLGILCALVAAPVLIVVGWQAWQRNATRAYVQGFFAASAIGALLIVPFVPLDALTGTDGCIKSRAERGIDPSYLLTPPYANPIVGAIVGQRYADRVYAAAGFVCYLGFVPLALAVVAVVAGARRVGGWLALFAAALVLALGSRLVWDNSLHEGVILPFALASKLPVLEHLRVANRFMALVGLALAALASYGAAAVLGALSGNARRYALPLGLALLLAEYSWLPYPVRAVEHSPLLRELAARPGAVLDVPFLGRKRTVRNQAAQTVHARPIAGGYVSIPHEPLAEFYNAEPALAPFTMKNAGGSPPRPVRVDIPRLRELGFATLVIHKASQDSARAAAMADTSRTEIAAFRFVAQLGGVPDRAIADIRRELDAALGGPALEDDLVAIYFLDER